jgi:hypothetical protein
MRTARMGAHVTDLEKTGSAGSGTPAASAGPSTEWHIVPIGGLRRTGVWRPRSRTVSVTLIGGLNLDLTAAEIDAPPITVTKVSLIGGVNLTVPPGTRVDISGFTLIGGRRVEPPQVDDGAPLVRLRAFGIIGGVHVSR